MATTGDSSSSATTLVMPASPSSASTEVLPTSPSCTTTMILPASSSSPTSVLQEDPQTDNIVPTSPDLSAPTSPSEKPIDAVPLRCFIGKPPMHWDPALSLLILNRICELVDRGVSFDRGFREVHLHRVCNNLLDFTGQAVTATQLYNHLRNSKIKWNMVLKLKGLDGVDWCDDTASFKMEEERLVQLRTCYPKFSDILNAPVLNYDQMKKIFTPKFIHHKHLYNPKVLIQALDHLADNKTYRSSYATMSPTERRAWLRAFLRKHYYQCHFTTALLCC